MQAEIDTGPVVRLNPANEDVPMMPDYSPDRDLLAANLVVGFEPMNERVHPFFNMRSQLLRAVHSTGKRVFGITSVQPGNGKTHISVNLAAALSRIYPTILIELDLRRPSIGNRLGLPQLQPGMDDYLKGDVSWRETCQRIHGFDLTVSRVRDPRGNAEELLASPRLAELIESLRGIEGSPVIIVDTPPALVHDDLMLISRVVDGVVMVVQEARTPKRALLDAINSLNPTPIIGSILNMSISSPQQHHDYGYYYMPPERGAAR